ncbi:hypothetical protein [Desulfobacula sp.]|uniref:hypothetical protein n=1 Tax=Desulfobacula sp. TaxID=2593537 RepID=UPI0026269AE4|nr:hypothetical protein [Desulfobacula sp.]
MSYQKKTVSKMEETLKTGELFVKEGLIRFDDIDMALSIQAKRQNSLRLKKKRLFGMILCDLNLITPMDTYYVLHKYHKLESIQSALISRNMLSMDKVLKAEEASQSLHIPFISQLLKNKLISISDMQTLLFDLFHIPFRSISDFIFNEKARKKLVQVLETPDSLEHRILPLVLKNDTVLFGITDPDNLLFLRQLNTQFPQYRFKALFIPFSGFSWFSKIIYNSSPGPSPPRETPLELSFLLSFKTTITDPEQETASIQTLYERYELLRHLIGNPERDNRHKEFNAFIVLTHRQITREYKSRCIEFYFKTEDKDLHVMAFPKR